MLIKYRTMMNSLTADVKATWHRRGQPLFGNGHPTNTRGLSLYHAHRKDQNNTDGGDKDDEKNKPKDGKGNISGTTKKNKEDMKPYLKDAFITISECPKINPYHYVKSVQQIIITQKKDNLMKACQPEPSLLKTKAIYDDNLDAMINTFLFETRKVIERAKFINETDTATDKKYEKPSKPDPLKDADRYKNLSKSIEAQLLEYETYLKDGLLAKKNVTNDNRFEKPSTLVPIKEAEKYKNLSKSIEAQLLEYEQTCLKNAFFVTKKNGNEKNVTEDKKSEKPSTLVPIKEAKCNKNLSKRIEDHLLETYFKDGFISTSEYSKMNRNLSRKNVEQIIITQKKDNTVRSTRKPEPSLFKTKAIYDENLDAMMQKILVETQKVIEEASAKY